MGLGRTEYAVFAWLPVLTVVACIFAAGEIAGAQQTAGISAGLPKTTAVADPVFEVAAIKPSQAGGSYASINTHHRDLSATNATVLDLIKWCYRLRDEQVRGGPDWMSGMKFDIVAQPDLSALPSADEDRLMMQKLLAERFHLAVHETQEVSSVYALSIGDGESRMVPSHLQGGHNSTRRKELDDGTTAIRFANTTMPDFLYTLMDSITDREIVDETGLNGEYDFTLIVPSRVLEGDADPGDLSAALFKAVESIRLQLKREKAPVRVMVIDRLEKPTPN